MFDGSLKRGLRALKDVKEVSFVESAKEFRCQDENLFNVIDSMCRNTRVVVQANWQFKFYRILRRTLVLKGFLYQKFRIAET